MAYAFLSQNALLGALLILADADGCELWYVILDHVVCADISSQCFLLSAHDCGCPLCVHLPFEGPTLGRTKGRKPPQVSLAVGGV